MFTENDVDEILKLRLSPMEYFRGCWEQRKGTRTVVARN
jgi:hypothetical protein